MKAALRSVAIGEVVERAQTWNPSRSSADEVFQYIDLSAVDQDAKVITAGREVSCGEAPSRARQLVESGDILVSTVRPNLNGVARVPVQMDGATASTGFCVLRANQTKANGAYLFHWVKSPAFITDMVSKATGASYPAVSDRIIFDSPIPLPPLAEQKRIAAILDAADALRAKRREALAQLDALLQSTFLTLFGDPVTNPMGWKTSPLSGVAHSIVDGPFGSNLKTSDYVATGVPVLQGKNITGDSFKWFDIRFITPTKARTLARSNARVDDHLLIKIGSIGYSAIIHDLNGHEFAIIPANMCRIRRDPKKVEALFLHAFLTNERTANTLRGLASKTAQPALSLGKIRALTIPLPPLSLQQKFATIVESIERQKDAQRAHLAELDSLFAALQHRAFRGEL